MSPEPPASIERRRMLARGIIRRQSVKSGWFGAATGLCAFIPGFGIVLGFLFWWLVDSPVKNHLTDQLCKGLVDAYLPDLDEPDQIAEMLADRRDPNRTGAFASSVDAVVTRAMNPMRDLEALALSRIMSLAGKLLLPFGIGAVLGFVVNYWEVHRSGRWAQDRLEVLSGVPQADRESYTDHSGWCGWALTVVALTLAAIVAAVIALFIRLF